MARITVPFYMDLEVPEINIVAERTGAARPSKDFSNSDMTDEIIKIAKVLVDNYALDETHRIEIRPEEMSWYTKGTHETRQYIEEIDIRELIERFGERTSEKLIIEERAYGRDAVRIFSAKSSDLVKPVINCELFDYFVENSGIDEEHLLLYLSITGSNPEELDKRTGKIYDGLEGIGYRHPTLPSELRRSITDKCPYIILY